MNHLIEKLNWRYSSKKMNGKKIPSEKLNIILEAIRLTPTSYGLQNFKVIIIEDKQLLEEIHQKACPQGQILECSQLLIFAAIRKIDSIIIDEYLEKVAENRGVSIKSLDGFKGMLHHACSGDEEKNFEWNARQTYIALGYATIAAALEEVDATPIEGFKPKVVDEILGLKEQNLGAVTMLTLGYRDAENDKYASIKKLRKSEEELFIRY